LNSQRPVTYTAKKDRYSRARGASQFLDLFCARCRQHILLYQKDGPGALKRLYLDRIFAPAPYSEWQSLETVQKVPNLTCPNCENRLGVPMVYRPEDRLAIRLIAGTFSKTRSNGTYTPPTTEE
jgi:hypothetical protein